MTFERELTAEEVERKLRAQFRPKFCAICGERSTCISKSGLSACHRHRNSPADQERYDWSTGELLAIDDRAQ